MKSRFLSLLLALAMLLPLLAFTGCIDPDDITDLIEDIEDITDGGNGKSQSPGKNPDSGSIRITPVKADLIRFEEFNNGLISIEIPEGWKVASIPMDYVHYTFKVYDPEDPDYQLMYILKLEGFPKTEAARAAWAQLYPGTQYGQTPALEPGTTEGFFKIWNGLAMTGNAERNDNYSPVLNGIEIQENLGTLDLGGDVLRISFTNDGGRYMQGIVTTTVMSGGSYVMYGYDFATLHTFNTFLALAPDDEFNNWVSVFDHMVGSLTFTEAFVNGFMKQETTWVTIIQANQRIYDQTSDMIMDSWNRRSDSYDIISQKRSDATLGYERVYDTETGDIYRAYNGFTDGYSGSRYQPVTDDMYKQTISGYIER